MSDLSYPIGKANIVAEISDEQRKALIEGIAAAPPKVRMAVKGLSEEHLDTPYRPEGWTVRQVVHHLADSHMNAYVRFKLALTEQEPAIKTYDEKQWATLQDSIKAPVEISLSLLELLHERWVLVLRSLAPADFRRTFQHPEWGKVTLDASLQLYEWHGRHHTAHITSLRERMNWK